MSRRRIKLALSSQPLPGNCPSCKARLTMVDGFAVTQDGGGDPGNPTPKPGLYTICCHCGALLKFGPRLQLLKVGNEEKARALRENPLLAEGLRFFRLAIARAAASRN